MPNVRMEPVRAQPLIDAAIIGVAAMRRGVSLVSKYRRAFLDHRAAPHPALRAVLRTSP